MTSPFPLWLRYFEIMILKILFIAIYISIILTFDNISLQIHARKYITVNNHNIYHTVYFYIQEIHGGAGLISRIEYLTYILEFETIHTEDLPSDWIIRDWIENLFLGRYPDIGFDIGRNPDNLIHLIQLIIRKQISTLFQYAS